MPSSYPNTVNHPYFTEKEYLALYQYSLEHPEKFWQEQAQKYIDFFTPCTTVVSGSLAQGNVRWFSDATLNVCYNCVDRHLAKNAEKTAFIWEGDDPELSQKISYRKLHEAVCRFANLLKSCSIKKGDRVCIYMPMIPEAVFAMLACARIGAVHSVVFGGFSAQSLQSRIQDAECTLVITADEGMRGGKVTPLKHQVDEALNLCEFVQHVIVVKRTQGDIHWDAKRNIDYHAVISQHSTQCEPEIMNAEDPLFILYTSGSTGKPKGILHTTAGYAVHTAFSFATVFNYQANDIYWCTADVGWITGHSYIVYGPLCNAATVLIFEGIPTYPDVSRFWNIVDKHHVTIFYTAPTALRALMREGNAPVEKTKRTSLRLLGTVGEPINPEAWEWYYHIVGSERCPIIDTWWQTETGGFMITPLAGVGTLKPGSATRPFFGIDVALLDEHGQEIKGVGAGTLVIKKPWPGMLRDVYGHHQRFLETYLLAFPHYYFTGDGARRDADGFYWITGRVDDIIIVSGHNLGSAEIESALVYHEHVAEAAIVGVPHALKGHSLYAYVTLMENVTPCDELRHTLISLVQQQIGPIARIDALQFAPQLPKTRSGKIMRRILRKIAAGELDSLGDVTTLADPSVVDELIKNRIK